MIAEIIVLDKFKTSDPIKNDDPIKLQSINLIQSSFVITATRLV